MGFLLDQILVAFGNQRALGRAQHRVASKLVWNEWNKFAGRNDIRIPTMRDFHRFMAVAFGIQTDEDDDADLDASINLDVLIPRVANALIDNGTLVTAEQRG